MDGLIGRAGALVVHSELSAHRSRVVESLQRVRNAEVVVAAPCGTQGEVGDLTDLVVAEVVRVGPPLADDTASPQLIEAANERFLVGFAGVREHIRRELSTDRRGDAGQIPGRLRQLREAAPDHGLHLRAHPPALDMSARPPGAQRLDHESGFPSVSS